MARQSAKMDADWALVWHAQSSDACQASVIIADPPASILSSGSGKEVYTVPVHRMAQVVQLSAPRKGLGAQVQVQMSVI